ncbi:YbhB/YbcL family Raf kinase inhibitor-like protein [uncultured Cetobacterium sp.]|uniref:YbhB/YbcL family Raf kinase inhibitor-like protein n=1 Tax=uncultured Cetobacterium sp. TaxID=527638 RepID=UPI0026161DE0|nr:YbhB/YbcL family Raf kinase inhibitor-like protein [uncultured Cetobacterium sp.]
MKKLLLSLFLLLGITSFSLELSSSGIKNGVIDKKYGTYGKDQFHGMPTLSLPLQWENAPKGTKQFALVMEDFDAVEAVGVIWLHWITLIPEDITSLPENASLTNPNLIQGENSWWSLLGGSLPKDEVARYGGPVPPNKTHTYTITLYALDTKLENLKKGFYLNELYDAMEGHVLEKTVLKAKYLKE